MFIDINSNTTASIYQIASIRQLGKTTYVSMTNGAIIESSMSREEILDECYRHEDSKCNFLNKLNENMVDALNLIEGKLQCR